MSEIWCPHCRKVSKAYVIDSSRAKNGEVMRRRRQCSKCRSRFTTREYIEEILPLVQKKDGRKEPYDRGRIIRSIELALGKEKDDPLVERAIVTINGAFAGADSVSSRDIATRIAEFFRKEKNIPALIRYDIGRRGHLRDVVRWFIMLQRGSDAVASSRARRHQYR